MRVKIKVEGVMTMAKEKMSKKLKQAVQHANETNPSTRSGTQPNSSRTEKLKS
ncbi:hypothetical protein [Bacillus sp. AFS015802]|uniref:hypothetical protein n=1 Tax=Bacillus sp. AFS015802 TaxID=2033486 RepID=UPI0015CF4877|nr:hypothetical protein [Bacillus sp. AFS015802]